MVVTQNLQKNAVNFADNVVPVSADSNPFAVWAVFMCFNIIICVLLQQLTVYGMLTFSPINFVFHIKLKY
jgi:hypothetical protein